MNLLHGFVPRSSALVLAIALSSFSPSPAFARGGHGGGHGGGHHGGGHHGGGGHHWGGGYHHVGRTYHYGGGYGYRVYRPRINYGYGYSSGYYNNYYNTYPSYNTYSSNYYATSVAQAPYLTNQTYEPGDGYRYPLYYNPATGTYFYYPVTR
jgi:hypothetical protein